MTKSETALAKTGALPDAPYWKPGRLLGHLDFMNKDPLNTMTRARFEVGDIVRLRLGFQPAFFLFNPKEVRRVLVDDAVHYRKTTRGYDLLRAILGNGLVTSEGDFWLRQRRIAQPAFHRDCISGFARTMARSTEDLVTRWENVARTGQTIDVAEAMNRLTLRIAGETLMSVDVTSDAREIGESMDIALSRFTELLASPLPWPDKWPTIRNFRLYRAVKTLHRVVDKVIAERRRSGAKIPDLMGMFMAAADPETGEGMTDAQLRDEILTMLLAGHETTANGLAWTLYALSLQPAIRDRVEHELDTVLEGRRVGVEDLASLPYLQQVIKESMRLYPPVWMIGRQADTECELGGYRIPKGSYIFISAWAIHRHPEYWPNPEAFDPDRFGPDREAPDRFTYLPFSRGQRQCIGDRFAEMEMAIVLATLLQHYRMAMAPGHPVEGDPSVTLRPRTGVMMSLEARN